MERPNSFLTIPRTILIGSLMISIAILVSGGIIKIGPKKTTQIAALPAASAVPAVPQQQTANLATVKSVFENSAIKFGDSSKKLIVVEVADPSCPYCHIAAGKNPQLNKEAGGQFTLVSDGGSYVAPVPEIQKLVSSGQAAFAYIYSPGHGNGELGTKALYCAFEKGKFWETHDLMMSSKGYDVLNNTVKNDKAKSKELADFLQPAVDAAFLQTCLESGKYDGRLNEDVKLAQTLGISGTPGFYFNETPFRGAYSYKDMETVVKEALK